MKRVLIIAYYWPPSAGSGVQRWLKFTKYLPEFGWQPVVFTPDNPSFELKDEGLLKEVPKDAEILKIPIWEPYSLHNKILGNKKKNESNAGIVASPKTGFSAKLSNWIRGNIFIPDPKIFWKKPAVKFLNRYLKQNPVDVIISTGTPHSMHLIAKAVAKTNNLPWLADFRDPWSKLDMLQSYSITASNFKKYQKLEKGVLEAADLCVTTSRVWKDDFKKLGAKKSICITNGYDKSDFNFEIEPYQNFVISHFGLLNHLRNPKELWQALAELCHENESFSKDLKIHLGGSISDENIEHIKKHTILANHLVIFDYLSHQRVIEEYLKSSVLLLLLFNSESGIGNIPGKLFEYLAAQKPILAFGAGAGDTKEIIESCRVGSYFNYKESNVEEIKSTLLEMYKNFKNDETYNAVEIERYSRQSLTKDLAQELNKLIEK